MNDGNVQFLWFYFLCVCILICTAGLITNYFEVFFLFGFLFVSKVKKKCMVFFLEIWTFCVYEESKESSYVFEIREEGYKALESTVSVFRY
jgi:hypothetical protein